jgi:hypothetical protein
MQVTFGEEGSGFSKAQPRFLPLVGNIGEAWPPFMLPLLLSLLIVLLLPVLLLLLLLLRWSLSTNVSMYFCFFLGGLVIDHGGEEGNNVRF